LATAHTKLVYAILKTYGSDERWRIWQNNTGSAYRGRTLVTFGKPGSPDIIGFMSCGRFVGIEVKVGRDKQSDQQLDFQAVLERYNGFYLVARSLDDVAMFLSQH
jgi:hypothetical protein